MYIIPGNIFLKSPMVTNQMKKNNCLLLCLRHCARPPRSVSFRVSARSCCATPTNRGGVYFNIFQHILTILFVFELSCFVFFLLLRCTYFGHQKNRLNRWWVWIPPPCTSWRKTTSFKCEFFFFFYHRKNKKWDMGWYGKSMKSMVTLGKMMEHVSVDFMCFFFSSFASRVQWKEMVV